METLSNKPLYRQQFFCLQMTIAFRLRHEKGPDLQVRASHQRLGASSKMRGLRSPSRDRKSTRLNSSHVSISYAVFCLKKTNTHRDRNHREERLPVIITGGVRR